MKVLDPPRQYAKPIEDRPMPKMLLEFDPEGSWRSHRFEFCNALEWALDETLSEESRSAAREALAMYGITTPAPKSKRNQHPNTIRKRR